MSLRDTENGLYTKRKKIVDGIWAKLEDLEDDDIVDEIENYYAGRNNKSVRQQYIRLAHYYYLLRIWDEPNYKNELMEKYLSIAWRKLQETKEDNGKLREIAGIYLINEHAAAWKLEQYYYEKATKILCQMMITLMDYILQEKAEFSILYNGKDKSNYFTLLDEIISLNTEYRECCCFLSAYDFCTSKIADFIGIEEYKQLIKEHERIVINGMPQKVTEAMEKLREIAGEKKAEYFTDIFKAYVPQPPYYEDILEKQYEKVVISRFGNEEKAMASFSQLVIKTGEFYEDCVEEPYDS